MLVLTAAVATAQSGRPPLTNDLRVDARFSRNTAIEAGWSFTVPTGSYVRNSATWASGYSSRGAGDWHRSTRVEVVSRFLLDPFREARYGLSLGAGFGVTNSEGLYSAPNAFGDRTLRWRQYIAVVADLELRKTAGYTPAVQVGLGGGLRVGLLVRTSSNRWR